MDYNWNRAGKVTTQLVQENPLKVWDGMVLNRMKKVKSGFRWRLEWIGFELKLPRLNPIPCEDEDHSFMELIQPGF